MKTKKPDYLKPPCPHTRKALTEWLQSVSNPRGWHCDGDYLFCFNVKAYGVDLSFDHLLKIHHATGHGEDGPSQRWLDECRAKYDSLDSDSLWNWGVESAQAGFLDDEAYQMLWNGKRIETELGFHGRSGGWLVLEKFNRYILTPDFDFVDLSWNDLTALAEIVQFIIHTSRNPSEHIEQGAAFDLFENICSGVQSDSEMEAEESARHDAACRDIVTVA